MIASAAIIFLIFKRMLFKLKNSRIHEPPNDNKSRKFYLAFSKKNIFKKLIEII
jgi:hypothetical protein